MSNSGRRFYIGNLPEDTQIQELSAFLGVNVKDAGLKIVRDAQTGKCKGFGFVHVPEGKVDDLRAFHDREFYGKPLKIQRMPVATSLTTETHNPTASMSGDSKHIPNEPVLEGSSASQACSPVICLTSSPISESTDSGNDTIDLTQSSPEMEVKPTSHLPHSSQQQSTTPEVMKKPKYPALSPSLPYGQYTQHASYTYHTDIEFRLPLIDIGANLTHKKFMEDLDDVVDRAKASGVQNVIVTGLHIAGCYLARNLTRRHKGFLYFTAGIHPHNAKSWNSDTEAKLEELAQSPECLAIGECGLDFNRNFSLPEKQLEVFEIQVKLACRLRKPLFLHERDSHDSFMEILNKYYPELPPVVVHCFTGKREEALKYLAMGYYIGLTGSVWRDTSADGVRKLLEDDEIPLDKLLLETDSPFMFPNMAKCRFRDKVSGGLSRKTQYIVDRYCSSDRNEPCAMPLVCELVAACMGRDVKDVAIATTMNAQRFFCLPQ